MNNAAFIDNLKQLFAECDTDKNGCLGREEFNQLCTKIGLNKEAAEETFNRLDLDKNDRITFDEFTAGFNQYKQANRKSVDLAQSKTVSRSSSSLPTSSSSSSSEHNNNYTTKRCESPPPVVSNNIPKSVKNNHNNNCSDHQQNKGYNKLSPVSGRQQSNKTKLSPNSSVCSRKQASPLGVMSLGSTGSSSNLLTTTCSSSSGGGRSSSAGADFSDLNSNDSSYPNYNNNNHINNIDSNATSKDRDSVVIYSSDNIGDYDQVSGNSDQFGSLMSSSGSFSQVRNMQDLLDCVQKLQSENQILSQIFFKDKREREEYINQLGEEFDLQVKEVEERANKRAKEELENEKKRLREMMQAERETLQHHYQTIEKMSKLIKTTVNNKTDENEGIDKVKSKLEDTYMENCQLKKSLLDTKTDVAMIWKEMEKLKDQYEDKLSSAYKRNNETRNECDHMKQQLNLMKDSNRKLQDASDVITNYITDKVDPVIKGATTTGSGAEEDFNGNQLNCSLNNKLGFSSQSSSRRGSILSRYINGNGNDSCDLEIDCPTTNNDQAKKTLSVNKSSVVDVDKDDDEAIQHQQKVFTTTSLLLPPSSHSKASPKPMSSIESSSSLNSNSIRQTSSESSKSSSSKSQDNPQSRDKVSSQQAIDNNSRSSTSATNYSVSADQSSIESNHNLRKSKYKQHASSLVELSNKPKELPNVYYKSKYGKHSASCNRKLSTGRHFFIGSREIQSEAHEPSFNNHHKSIHESSSNDIRTRSILNLKSLSLDHSDFPTVEPSDGPSKATFDIILVGDSFVGKSSFAARFMEGTFVKGLVSNCSIDFKTRSYKIDGVNYTVNIWDTAGQERFRSITASYFRKADGIILMYDVTDRRSYLNVRNWMSTISDTASENVAVLLVGNKIDLRRKDNKDKCVPTKEGSRLAKEYDIVFLETSVKTGTNLVPSMGKLIRMIAQNNLPIIEDNDRIKLNDKSKSFTCMPNKC